MIDDVCSAQWIDNLNTGKLQTSSNNIFISVEYSLQKIQAILNLMLSKNPPSKQPSSVANPKASPHIRTLSITPKQQPVPSQQTTKNTKHQTSPQKLNTPKQSHEDPEKTRSNMLMSCRSFPNILLTNSYIKLDGVSVEGIGYEHMFTQLSTSTEKQRRRTRQIDLIRKDNDSFGAQVKQKLDRAEKNIERQCEQALRKPKFARKNTTKFQKQASHTLAPSSSQSLIQNYTEVVQQNSILKLKLLQSEQKIQQLNTKIQSLSIKKQPSEHTTLNLNKTKALELQLTTTTTLLTERTNQLNSLTTRISQLQKQNTELTEQIKQLNKQKQKYHCPETMFQGIELEVQQFEKNLSGGAMNNSGIMMDMLSTAEYIESLTDLQDQLHNKKSEIFDLNKAIEQLKIKQHFIELRNQQAIRRINDEWSNKYKRLLNMYKAIKASRSSENSRMKKLKTKTQFIDQEKEDLFNLSLSTDRSQLPFN